MCNDRGWTKNNIIKGMTYRIGLHLVHTKWTKKKNSVQTPTKNVLQQGNFLPPPNQNQMHSPYCFSIYTPLEWLLFMG